ncbi:MAG: tetratricopeptide repeat protein [Clostridia bacterium]|nr:tetratricopeptide repeat protein [Clostridia bacterium]
MERCDFASVTKIINEGIFESAVQNQTDFIYLIFDDFTKDENQKNLAYDSASVCKWMNGNEKLPSIILKYYSGKDGLERLKRNVTKNIVPILSDIFKTEDEIYRLIISDVSVSRRKRDELTKKYHGKTEDDCAEVIANVLHFGMMRDFVERDKKTKKPTRNDSRSPVLSEIIMGCDTPKPCRYFCGREEELQRLHEALAEHGKVFLHGIGGIGKSELVKEYARRYKKDYTNIIYIFCGGDLKKAITDLDFVDDTEDEDGEKRFLWHSRLLSSLKQDSLLIIDNFNSSVTEDGYLAKIMEYNCRILFTTRGRPENYHVMELSEISDKTVLLELMRKYYSDAEGHRDELMKIIDAVHGHTLATELAARLLERGMLNPRELLYKLQTKKTALDDNDKISVIKDGKPASETYGEHIRTLFALHSLSEEQMMLMRCMALVPLSGIDKRLFNSWLSLDNLNGINGLTELGLITPISSREISLHPMIRDTAISDLKPSVSNCRTMILKLEETCLRHGEDIPYYKEMFQTIENIVSFIEKDDIELYLRFLGNVFPYMEKYKYTQEMRAIIKEQQTLLKNPSVGCAEDRALNLDSLAAVEENTDKAIELEKEALSLLPHINKDNAHLISNIHANIGTLYCKKGEYKSARQHMEKGYRILQKYDLAYMHDAITQTMNYAVCLSNMGNIEDGMEILQELEPKLDRKSGDYAILQEAMGGIFLMKRNFSEALKHYKNAIDIYKVIWMDSCELMDSKVREIEELFIKAGYVIPRKFLQ